ncbi:Retrovirus-related Pol polyprotein from transposon [Zancudomyces culisetae]|uniref:Retrovirus-related Pol polyprotein from transposon n=1 Tax=Zancudomyces culisetae TaxID=1213189 RepID=A0A1R1PDA8_ZANCU|nr:Retrovirus-related Pol polyprotein from transposon [Zancudomyces culisetae]|eukprot:OMH78852.1 Retrovirus-related Pol polyprotein from transposon [Zancudomyces culisetae]
MQEEGKRPISYASRITNVYEKNYSVTHLEGLAVIWSIKKFKYYLWGKHFTIRTDHKSLLQLFDGTEITGRVARWAMILRNYNYTITHCPGKYNPADALSRTNQPYFESWKSLHINRYRLLYLVACSIGEFWGAYSGIKHSPTTSYRPQSNGQVERLNQTFKNALVKQCRKDKDNWDQYIWKTLLAIRTLRNQATQLSPAELLYGMKITTPSIWTPPAEVSDMDIALQERIDSINSDLPALRHISLVNSAKSKEKKNKI